MEGGGGGEGGELQACLGDLRLRLAVVRLIVSLVGPRAPRECGPPVAGQPVIRVIALVMTTKTIKIVCACVCLRRIGSGGGVRFRPRYACRYPTCPSARRRAEPRRGRM
jgi:hypothetical protein